MRLEGMTRDRLATRRARFGVKRLRRTSACVLALLAACEGGGTMVPTPAPPAAPPPPPAPMAASVVIETRKIIGTTSAASNWTSPGGAPGQAVREPFQAEKPIQRPAAATVNQSPRETKAMSRVRQFARLGATATTHLRAPNVNASATGSEIIFTQKDVL